MSFTAEILLIFSALVFGLRHGIDWDHIAAITDITSSQERPRDGMWLGTVYAMGHASVVTVLGMLAVLVGASLPDWVDRLMEPFVGITLLVLGLYVIYSLLKDRENFRMRSRWMLLFEWAEVGYRWLVSKLTGVESEKIVHRRDYGFLSAYLVGMIHGIGAETPTQVLLFVAAAGAAGRTQGVILVLTFIVGLLISNSIITVMATYSFLRARRNTSTLMVLGSIAAVFSMTVGTLFLLGQGGVLPAIFGG